MWIPVLIDSWKNARAEHVGNWPIAYGNKKHSFVQLPLQEIENSSPPAASCLASSVNIILYVFSTVEYVSQSKDQKTIWKLRASLSLDQHI